MNQYNIQVLDEYKTIEKLQNGNCSFVRFGDGEFELVFNTGIHFFKSLVVGREIKVFNNGGFFLNRKLKAILQSNDKKLLIGIPNVFDDGSEKKWKSQYFYNNRQRIADLLRKDIVYGSAFYTRYNSKDPNKDTLFQRIQQIWEGKNIAIINFYPNIIEHEIFSNAKSVSFIRCKQRNAYGFFGVEYRKVFKKCQSSDADILLCSAGPITNLLAYDLNASEKICIDIGQLARIYDSSFGKESMHLY